MKRIVLMMNDWFNMFHYDFIEGNAAAFAH